MPETPKSFEEAKSHFEAAYDPTEFDYDDLAERFFEYGRTSLTPKTAPAQTAVGEGELPARTMCLACKGTGKTMRVSFVDHSTAIEQDCNLCHGKKWMYKSAEEIEAQLRDAIAQRDEVERKGKGLCQALGTALMTICERDAKITELEAQRDEANHNLAECYRWTGADTDGNEDWRLALKAVSAVIELRGDSDAEIARLEAKLAVGKPEPGELERLAQDLFSAATCALRLAGNKCAECDAVVKQYAARLRS